MRPVNILLMLSAVCLSPSMCFSQAEFFPDGEHGVGAAVGVAVDETSSTYSVGAYHCVSGRFLWGATFGHIGVSGSDLSAYGVRMAFVPLKPSRDRNAAGITLNFGYDYYTRQVESGSLFGSRANSSFNAIAFGLAGYVQTGLGELGYCYPQIGVGRSVVFFKKLNVATTVLDISVPFFFGQNSRAGLSLTPSFSYAIDEESTSFAIAFGGSWW